MSNKNPIRTLSCAVALLVGLGALSVASIEARVQAEPGVPEQSSGVTPPATKPLIQSVAVQTPPPASAQATGATLQISMQQAEAMALETNLGLKAAGLAVDIAAQNIVSARAAFLPTFQSNFRRNTSVSASQNFLQGSSSTITSAGLQTTQSVFQSVPWLGGGYQVSWSSSRNTTNGYSNFNPQLGSSLQILFTQPLWRNLFTDQNRFTLDSSQRQHQIADLTLQQQVVQTRASVDSAYLGLIAAIAGSKVAQQNMELAQQQLKDSQARVKVGAAAQSDIIQAQAQVANNEEQVIVAAASIATAEDNLRAIMLDPNRPDYWQAHLEPTEVIEEGELAAPEIDVDGAIKNALANRLDLLVAHRNLDITDQALRLDENLTHPQLDFNLSYLATGTGGTQFTYTNTLPPTVLSETQRGFRTVLGDAFSNVYPQLTLGVLFTYPLGTNPAQAAQARDRLTRQQQEIALKNLELQVETAVRQAGRQVATNIKRVQATLAAQRATEQQLDAEKRRFEVGLSSTFQVQNFESQLAQVRVSALNARIAYRQSLIDFQTVQRIPH
jgi:outer membrane protein